MANLKMVHSDQRSIFIKKLIDYSQDQLNFNILGLYNEQPKWNHAFYNQLKLTKTALNLSRGRSYLNILQVIGLLL